MIKLFIAHRGLVTKDAKENTIPAFLGAIKNDAYAGFELDVYTSKDHVFVIHHNPLIANKFIWNYTYKELQKKGVVRLVDVLKLKHSKIILIDIKDININISEFSRLLNKYRHHKIYVMSFFNSVLKKFPKTTFKIGLLNYVLNTTNPYNYDFICLLYDITSNSLINAFKKENIPVFIYAISPKDKFIYKDTYYIIDAKLLPKT